MTLLDWIQTLNIRALWQRVIKLEEQMATIAEFAAQIDSASTRMGDDIKAVADEIAQLKDQIAAGDTPDLTSLDAAVTKLNATADQLHALASPDNPDNPVPVPSGDGTDGSTPQA